MIRLKSLYARYAPRDRFEWFLFSLHAATVIAICLMVYWLYIDSNPPLVVNNEPLPIVSTQAEYEPGDTIIFELDACRKSQGAIRSTRYWVDGIMYQEPQINYSGAEIECFVHGLPVTVPKLPPGHYRVEYHVAYFVNGIRQWRLVSYETQEFTIVAPKSSPDQ